MRGLRALRFYDSLSPHSPPPAEEREQASVGVRNALARYEMSYVVTYRLDLREQGCTSSPQFQHDGDVVREGRAGGGSYSVFLEVMYGFRYQEGDQCS